MDLFALFSLKLFGCLQRQDSITFHTIFKWYEPNKF